VAKSVPLKVPIAKLDVVALVKSALLAMREEAKREVEVAFVAMREEAENPVVVAFVATRDDE
jgi:hypothetical protein